MLISGSLLLAGCGGGGTGEPSAITVIAKVSGDGQEGIVGQKLSKPIQVLVTQNNAPLPDAALTWSTDLTEGTLTPASGTTDGNGLASVDWTLGPHQGLHTVTVTVNDAVNASVNFTAHALHDVPAAMVKVVGDNQKGMVNTVLAHIQARVMDRFENGIGGVGVLWSVSNGTLAAETVLTDPSGLAIAQVTLGGTAGPVTITATADGLTGSPLTFTATAEAAPAEAAVLISNSAFTSDRNSTKNPAVDTVAAGATVTWTWGNIGSTQHSVQSVGSPSFSSSAIKGGSGQTHAATFSAPGVYQYVCAVHPSTMTGRIVVR
jgi:plastocyanin